MVPDAPPTSRGARKSPRERTKAKVAPARRPGSESGRMTRKKSFQRASAEVLRSFDERAGDVFERGVNRKEDEWRVDVGEHEDDGEGAVEQEADRGGGDMEILQEAVEDAVAAENCFPGVAAHEIADPQRDDDELIEDFLARAGVKGKIVGQRITEQQGAERDGGGDAHAAEQDFGVNGIGD